MLTGSYSSSLVLISLCVAILASYTALDLTGRIATAKGRAACLWMGGGALAMGIGVWSMHFIGMLAFSLPIDLGYDLALTAFSLLIAVLSSGFALWLVSQPSLPALQLGFGALIMGAGIACMHYTGMAALRMLPGIEGLTFGDAGLARNPGQDLGGLHDENSFQFPGEAASR